LNVGGAIVRFALEQRRGISVHRRVRNKINKINVLYPETSLPFTKRQANWLSLRLGSNATETPASGRTRELTLFLLAKPHS